VAAERFEPSPAQADGGAPSTPAEAPKDIEISLAFSVP
jgi:hypothetical protein